MSDSSSTLDKEIRLPRRAGRTPANEPSPDQLAPRGQDEPFMVTPEYGRVVGVSYATVPGSTPGYQRVPSPIVELELDEQGRVIAADRFGAAIALADNPADAYAAWEEAAREQYEDLSANESRLHPRLHQQLYFLRKFFG